MITEKIESTVALNQSRIDAIVEASDRSKRQVHHAPQPAVAEETVHPDIPSSPAAEPLANSLQLVVFSSPGNGAEVAQEILPVDDEADSIIPTDAISQPMEVVRIDSASSDSPSAIIANTLQDIGETFLPTTTAAPEFNATQEEVGEIQQLVLIPSPPQVALTHDDEPSLATGGAGIEAEIREEPASADTTIPEKSADSAGMIIISAAELTMLLSSIKELNEKVDSQAKSVNELGKALKWHKKELLSYTGKIDKLTALPTEVSAIKTVAKAAFAEVTKTQETVGEVRLDVARLDSSMIRQTTAIDVKLSELTDYIKRKDKSNADKKGEDTRRSGPSLKRPAERLDQERHKRQRR